MEFSHPNQTVALYWTCITKWAFFICVLAANHSASGAVCADVERAAPRRGRSRRSPRRPTDKLHSGHAAGEGSHREGALTVLPSPHFIYNNWEIQIVTFVLTSYQKMRKIIKVFDLTLYKVTYTSCVCIRHVTISNLW